jgi:3-oxoacyl-(acyl-carrier-protein) synthase
MPGKVYITGLGIISAIGDNVESNLLSLRKGKSGIGKIKFIHTRHADVISAGEVPYSDKQLHQKISAEETLSRTSLLGLIAAEEAYCDAGLNKSDSDYRTAIVSATSVGGMGIAENHFLEYLDPSGNAEYLNYIKQLDCSDSTEKIAAYLGISHYLTTISTACSSSANSIMFGARLIESGRADRVLVGGTDSISRFTINGFHSLKILDPLPCRPFDASRAGLNLGEGAAYLVLESEASSRGKKVYCTLSGYGNANDAYHQTASSPEGTGAYLAMNQALRRSGLKPSEISYINAHGTGTEINDLSEGMAIEKTFGENIPPFSSTKAFTGHTLAAAGGVEAVFSVLSLVHGIIFPNLHYREKMPELKIEPCATIPASPTGRSEREKLNHVLSNSFGFGGNTSALIFSRV